MASIITELTTDQIPALSTTYFLIFSTSDWDAFNSAQVAALTSTQIAALFGTFILTMLPSINFSGLIAPVSSMSGGAALMGASFPASHFLAIAVGTYTKALGFAALAPKYLHLLGFGIVYVGLAWRLLRKQEA